jgi:peroxiredoxin
MPAGPAVGEQAPDFELPASATTRMRLSDVLKDGPVVLLYYVLDFSPG